MMKQTNYLKEIDKVIETYLHNPGFLNNEYLNGQYTLMSAGLCNYLPSIDAESHAAIFTKLLLHKKLSAMEQSLPAALDHLTTEGLSDDILHILKTRPSIICTFHTGSYRLLNLLLTKKEIDFTLVIGSRVINDEGAGFTSMFKHFSNHNELNIINAEDPKAGLQMLRELKRGKSLVLYIDGNSGTQVDHAKNDNRCLVDFLNQKIFARKGIAFLAYTANVPVLTVACYRKDWHDIRMKFFPPVCPEREKGKLSFAKEATQKIYDFVAPLIQQYPEQWEGWLYIHKMAKIVNVENRDEEPVGQNLAGDVRFNLSGFGIFRVAADFFLFNKISYDSFPVDEHLFLYLRKSITVPVNPDEINRKIFNQLYSKKVLLYL